MQACQIRIILMQQFMQRGQNKINWYTGVINPTLILCVFILCVE